MPRLRDIVFFIALLATALAMGAALAHALELPNKIHMSQADYFVVQQIYRGWDRLAILLAVELVSLLLLAALYGHDRRVLIPLFGALCGLVAAQAVFWIWTFPANAATNNWTAQPEAWRQLRSQWEYSHLVGAGFQLLAFASLAVAALRRKD